MGYLINDRCIGCQACLTICPTGAVTGEKKERHHIDGNLCIDCGACGRVCPAAAVLDNFGTPARRILKKKWDVPVVEPQVCMSCGMCVDACPAGALDMLLTTAGNPHPFPVVTVVRCMACGFCEAECPVSAIQMQPRSFQKPSGKAA